MSTKKTAERLREIGATFPATDEGVTAKAFLGDVADGISIMERDLEAAREALKTAAHEWDHAHGTGDKVKGPHCKPNGRGICWFYVSAGNPYRAALAAPPSTKGEAPSCAACRANGTKPCADSSEQHRRNCPGVEPASPASGAAERAPCQDFWNGSKPGGGCGLCGLPASRHRRAPGPVQDASAPQKPPAQLAAVVDELASRVRVVPAQEAAGKTALESREILLRAERTRKLMAAAASNGARFTMSIPADHDRDLDLLVCDFMDKTVPALLDERDAARAEVERLKESYASLERFDYAMMARAVKAEALLDSAAPVQHLPAQMESLSLRARKLVLQAEHTLAEAQDLVKSIPVQHDDQQGGTMAPPAGPHDGWVERVGLPLLQKLSREAQWLVGTLGSEPRQEAAKGHVVEAARLLRVAMSALGKQP